MNLSLHELADKELRETAEYYELQKEGLGDVFLNEVERVFNFIIAKPEASPEVYKNMRKRVLSRFPYTIFYSIKESTISVLAIANQKRRPWYWRNR